MNEPTRDELKREVLYKSLIGNQIEILSSNNQNQVGIKGKILYETANFFEIEKNGSIIKILKKNITFKIKLRGKDLKVDGRLLNTTIINRIKKIK